MLACVLVLLFSYYYCNFDCSVHNIQMYVRRNHFEGTVEDEDEVAAIEQPSVSSAEHSCGSRGGNLSSPSATHYQDTPPHQSGRRKGGVAEQTSAPVAERGQGGGGGGDDNREGQRRRQSPPPCLDIASTDILTHISDNLVKPIVNNRAIETIEKHTYTPPTKGSSTHFQPLSLEQLSSLSQAKIESHLSHVSNLQHPLAFCIRSRVCWTGRISYDEYIR